MICSVIWSSSGHSEACSARARASVSASVAIRVCAWPSNLNCIRRSNSTAAWLAACTDSPATSSKEGIAASEIAADYVSRDLFLMILEDTEEHIDWLETQLDIITKIGIQNYLQSQLEP